MIRGCVPDLHLDARQALNRLIDSELGLGFHCDQLDTAGEYLVRCKSLPTNELILPSHLKTLKMILDLPMKVKLIIPHVTRCCTGGYSKTSVDLVVSATTSPRKQT